MTTLVVISPVVEVPGLVQSPVTPQVVTMEPRAGCLEVGDQVVVVVSMRSGQRFIKRCKAAKTAAGTGTILAK